jgi:hypothetical protein
MTVGALRVGESWMAECGMKSLAAYLRFDEEIFPRDRAEKRSTVYSITL